MKMMIIAVAKNSKQTSLQEIFLLIESDIMNLVKKQNMMI